METPTYQNMGDHSEAIAVDFDPSIISYDEILDIIWQSHSPISSFGSRQYRSAIWHHNDKQKSSAESSREKVANMLQVSVDQIKTALEPAGDFTYAEDYHQKYILRQQRDLIGDIESLFDNHIALSDSTVATRLNGWFGNSHQDPNVFCDEISDYGLPPELEERVKKAVLR